VYSDAKSNVDQPFIFHFQVVAQVAKEICYSIQRWQKLNNVSKNPLAVTIVMKVPLGD
jgi:hypothetical protein